MQSFRKDLMWLHSTKGHQFTALFVDCLKNEHLVKAIHCMQTKLFSYAEVKKEAFDVNVHCQNILDLCFCEADL